MLQTEFLRNLNRNYERIQLEESPEEQRYQYCMVSRGGIKGLLDCSLRYINGRAYLYYDISSKQNVVQTCVKRPLTRQWIKDFVWSFRQIREELSRFLLDERHVLWFPEQIFCDVENADFYFLYVPYYEEDNGFGKLLEFLVEHIDYEDETLVECVYRMYEQFDKAGWDYLTSQIFHDMEILEQQEEIPAVKPQEEGSTAGTPESLEDFLDQELASEERGTDFREEVLERPERSREKKGFPAVFKSRKRREREKRESYQNALQIEMMGYAVAEETPYEAKEWGRTVYMETPSEDTPRIHSLYTREGRLLADVDKESLVIGKKKEEADVVLEDISVSRMHARIVQEAQGTYIEDLNSTNGTYKNGLRLEPYEKRLLEVGDEIRIGKKELLYR